MIGTMASGDLRARLRCALRRRSPSPCCRAACRYRWRRGR